MKKTSRGLTGPIIYIDECCFLNKYYIKAKIRKGSKYKTRKSIKTIKGFPLAKNSDGYYTVNFGKFKYIKGYNA